ncbi:MAG: hypothetical protein KKE86_17220, partial [Planctomycetes bacterium]|nr:hypothetical protein [Planctomycetota bacterium]
RVVADRLIKGGGMGEGMMGAGVVMGLLILVFAVVSILVPFFVLRIRNEAIKTNQKLDTIIGLLRK